MPTAPLSFWQGQGLAVLCLLVALLLRLAIQPALGNRGVFLTFLPTVLVASFWGGPWSGVTTLGLGAGLGAILIMVQPDALRNDAASYAFVISFLISGGFILAAGVLFQHLVAAHRAAENEARLLAREMRHRLRNLLGLIGAISHQTARRTRNIAEYETHFHSRLDALSAALALNAEEEAVPDDLDTLFARVLEPFGHDRCQLTGPPIELCESTATPLALTVHELATNAVKYGALSVPEGRVEITWRRDAGRVLVEWREIGGPPVQEPAAHGFGTRLIRSIFSAGVGETEIAYHPEGVVCRIRF